MKISINQSELSNALSIVSKGVSTRTTLPVLSGIYFKAYDNTLTLESTDTNVSVRCSAAALVEEEGETVIPSRLINDVVKNLPDAAIHLSADETEATVLCDTSSFSIKTFSPQDFPAFPQMQPDSSLTVSYDSFARMVKQVSKFISNDDGHPIYTGVMIECKQGLLRMVATDTYRLAISEIDFDDQGSEFDAVIQGSFLNDAASLPHEQENVNIGVSENQIIVNYGTTTLITRRIEGTYPNTDRLFGEQTDTTVEFDTKQLLDASKRVSLLSNKIAPLKFDVNLASQTTQLSTSSHDIGAAQETISSAISGQDAVIAFNSSFVIQGLSLVQTEKVTFELPESRKLGIFKSLGNERFTYLIIAVRLDTNPSVA